MRKFWKRKISGIKKDSMVLVERMNSLDARIRGLELRIEIASCDHKVEIRRAHPVIESIGFTYWKQCIKCGCHLGRATKKDYDIHIIGK